jgi:hypothetical protein
MVGEDPTFNYEDMGRGMVIGQTNKRDRKGIF